MAIQTNNVAAVTTNAIVAPGGVIDAVFKNASSLSRLKKKEGEYVGGLTMDFPFFYKGGADYSGGWYEGADVLQFGTKEVMTSQKFTLREFEKSITVTGRDLAINTGQAARVRLLASLLEGLELAVREQMTAQIFGGTNFAKGVTPVTEFLKDAGVNYAGVSSADFAGYVAHVEANGGTPRALSTYLDQKCVSGATEGSQKPTLRIMRNDTMDTFIELLKPNQRTTRESTLNGQGHADQNTLVYSGIDSIVDNQFLDKAIGYFNEKYFRMYSHPKYNMIQKEFGDMETMDAVLNRVMWKGFVGNNNLRSASLLDDLIA